MPPRGLSWRSSSAYIITTVGFGMFSDLFLYGIVVPVLPFMLERRLHIAHSDIQNYSSGLLAAYAGASVVCSLPAGFIADRVAKRRSTPFLAALASLLAATVLLFLGRSFPVLVVARILQGISGGFVWTIGFTLILDTVGPDNLGKTLGTVFGVNSVGELAAPVIGGVMYDKTGFGGVFGISIAVLVVDLVMRLLLIEKKVAREYTEKEDQAAYEPNEDERVQREANENDPLLDRDRNQSSDVEEAESDDDDNDSYTVPPNQSRLIRTLPILYTFTNPRIPVALYLSLVQALLLGSFDATIPTVANDYYGINSLAVGSIFVSLIMPYLVGGPAAGWLVDRRGPKLAAVVGFGYMVLTLNLLRFVTPGGSRAIALFCVILAFNGIGIALIGSPSLVEASVVVQRYADKNPDFFGKNGPYAQLYGFHSMVFSLGLTLGPLIGGSLTQAVGYANMNTIMSSLSALAFLLSIAIVEGPPSRLWQRRAD